MNKSGAAWWIGLLLLVPGALGLERNIVQPSGRGGTGWFETRRSIAQPGPTEATEKSHSDFSVLKAAGRACC
jgi:hypothetical protein